MGAAKKAGGQVASIAKPVLSNPMTYIAPTQALPAAGLKAAGGAIGGPVGNAISQLGGALGLPTDTIGKLTGLTPKAKVDTTAATEAYINSHLPAFQNPLNSDGTLKSAYSVATPSKIGASTVASPDKVTAGTVAAGTLTPQLLDTAKLGVDTRALDAMRTKGLTQGPTDWAKAAMAQNALAELSAKDQAGAQALSGRDAALSSLAMRGGLGGGAAERLATSASRDMNAARQAASRTRAGADLSTSIADETQKNALLSNVASQDLSNAAYGADLAKFNAGTANDASKFNIGNAFDASKFNVGTALDASKFNVGTALDAGKFNAGQTQQANEFNTSTALQNAQFNTGNALKGLDSLNQYNMGKFQTQIAGYGAAKSADATQNAGKK